MVGRETGKNRLRRMFSQPWASSVITCRRA
jgi:hypothetical protein